MARSAIIAHDQRKSPAVPHSEKIDAREEPDGDFSTNEANSDNFRAAYNGISHSAARLARMVFGSFVKKSRLTDVAPLYTR